MTGHLHGQAGVARIAVALTIVAIVSALALVAYSRRDGAANAEAEPAVADLPPGVVDVPEAAQKNAGVQTLSVARRMLPSLIEVTGVVAPDERRVSHVRPLARGVIENIPVTLGARVASGETLVSYDNIELGELIGDYLSEIAMLRQAEADVDVKQRALERAEALIKLEAVALQTVELRRAESRNADAAVASQRARIAKIEEQIHRFGLSDADLKTLTPEEGRSGHRTASHSVLRAPFAGVVTKFDVATGELVQPDRELMTVTDLSTVWVLADVYEKDLARVKADTNVNIKVDAYPQRAFVGRLTYIGDSIDPQTRTAKVRCVIANPDSALKLDMFVKVSVPTRDNRETVVVDASAIQQIDGQPVVFVRQSPTRFERRPVQIGVTAGDTVEILSGVVPGDVVVGAGSFYLKTALLRERVGGES